MPRRDAERARRRHFEDAVAQVLEGEPPDDAALDGAGVPLRWRRRTRNAAEAVKAGKTDPREAAAAIAEGAFTDGAGPTPHPGHARANAALAAHVERDPDTRRTFERLAEARSETEENSE